VRVQGNGPRARRLRASGAKAVQEQCAGDATRRGDPVGGYAGVPTVFLQHTRLSSGGLVREQENPEVRGGVGIANQTGSIVLSQGSTTTNSSYPSLITQPTTITTGHREEYPSGHLPPTAILGKLLRHPRSLVTVEHFSSPILFAMRIHFPPVLLHNQGYPKVCPDSMNLSSAGDPFCRNVVIFFLSSVFPYQGLNCFDLEGSRVFSIKLPELSLFQISELLHFIGIRKKFIKIQNQFCLSP
jgi:hypothetical protein